MVCLAGNATAPPTYCGVDDIPFGEEKCHTDACPPEATDGDAAAAAAPPAAPVDDLVEVCEEVEDYEDVVDDDDDDDDDVAVVEEGSGDDGSGAASGEASGEASGYVWDDDPLARFGRASGLGVVLAGRRAPPLTASADDADMMMMMMGDDPLAGQPESATPQSSTDAAKVRLLSPFFLFLFLFCKFQLVSSHLLKELD